MKDSFINVGYGNMVASQRILAIINTDSLPVRRMVAQTKERGKLVDATGGKKQRSLIVTDSDFIVLSSLRPEGIANRYHKRKG